jgi:hypothetical protein
MIRKIYNIAALLLITVTSVVAQDATTTTTAPADLKNKKGEAYLPVADEWAIGVSASPFLRYFGNFMSGNTNNGAPTFDYAANPAINITNGIAIFGKKMIDANTAYRVRFNVNVASNINKAVVDQDRLNSNPNFPAFSEDWQKLSNTTVIIAPGYEFRRGSTRLQGFYGGELVVGLNARKATYQYGNSMTADFQAPTTHTFAPAGGFSTNTPNGTNDGSVRVTEEKLGMQFLVGARGFIGVEYFIIPKMSIGGEFGYMVSYRTQGRNLRTTEVYDPALNGIRTTKFDEYSGGLGSQAIGIGLDNLSANINLLFYF